MKIIQKLFLISALTVSLNACSSFFDKDNTPLPTPLTSFPAEAKIRTLWYTSTGVGSTNEDLKLTPAIAGTTIFTTSKNGTVAANDIQTGKSLWSTGMRAEVSSGATANAGLVYVGSRDGDVYALDQSNGKMLWKALSSNESLAPAAINNRIVLVKTIDGHVNAFSTVDGHSLWQYQQTEPNLILRGSSAPQITHDSVIVGFENGELAKLALRDGHVQWQKTIADPQGIFAVQRMVDIDADPIVVGNRVYAATYQGRIAALDLSSGEEFWNHDISSYAGIASDGSHVFVSDAKSHLWAFNAAKGTVNWEQSQLAARTITGPVIMGRYVVVGDGEGFLHWISKEDGHFVARVQVNKSGITATPLVYNNVLYVYTKDGHLAAYTIG